MVGGSSASGIVSSSAPFQFDIMLVESSSGPETTSARSNAFSPLFLKRKVIAAFSESM